MDGILDDYAKVAGGDVINHLLQLATPLKGMKLIHVNSTRMGGGVAEILTTMIPLTRALGIDTRWEVISGDDEFYQCTKLIHNSFQGSQSDISDSLWEAYETTNAKNAEKLRPLLESADIVFIHDPQPAPLLKLCPNRKGKWIWRCHIDASHPYRSVWKYLSKHIDTYDASVFSLADFAHQLPHPIYLIPPSIDPLSDKNVELPQEEIQDTCKRFDVDLNKPMMLQVSRFDRFKDPLGVIKAYRMAKEFIPDMQLVLAGGNATDDPEGEVVLQEVWDATKSDPDIHILLLPADSHRTINALQRAADFVVQKSIKEGFGLTVAEALWKGKPVIGGDTGGIRLQVINHHTGFLVNSPEGAALRVRYLHHHGDKLKEMGIKAHEFVRQNFLMTRHLREYLTLMVGLIREAGDRIEVE
jgi:trehalose synthase